MFCEYNLEEMSWSHYKQTKLLIKWVSKKHLAQCVTHCRPSTSGHVLPSLIRGLPWASSSHMRTSYIPNSTKYLVFKWSLKGEVQNIVFRAEVIQRLHTCEKTSLKVVCFHFADVKPKIPPWYQYGKNYLEFLSMCYYILLLYMTVLQSSLFFLMSI